MNNILFMLEALRQEHEQINEIVDRISCVQTADGSTSSQIEIQSQPDILGRLTRKVASN